MLAASVKHGTDVAQYFASRCKFSPGNILYCILCSQKLWCLVERGNKMEGKTLGEKSLCLLSDQTLKV